jgi:hypothetical protein
VVVLTAAVLLLGACSDDPEEAAAPAPAAPAASAASTAASSPAAPPGHSVPLTDPGGTGKPEIATNPDGTINSGGPRPGTSETVVTAGGFGPYKIGVAQKDLEKSDLVGKVDTAKSGNCTGYGTAKGIKKYKTPTLVFFKGRLLRVTVTAADVPTDKGVKVGAPIADVQKAYPAGKQLEDSIGRPAWLASVGDFGLLFDMQNQKVAGIQAGMAEPMQFKYTDNQGC